MRGEVLEMKILTASLHCAAVSGFEIYYTEGVRFLFNTHIARNPPQP